jgi:hypothetical protein
MRARKALEAFDGTFQHICSNHDIYIYIHVLYVCIYVCIYLDTCRKQLYGYTHAYTQVRLHMDMTDALEKCEHAYMYVYTQVK